MSKVREFLEEHLRTLLVALILVIAVVLATVVFSVVVGETGDRVLYVSEVAGGASVIKGDGQIAAGRNMSIASGDVIVTDSEGIVKLKTDTGKYIYIEPSSTVYVNYTEKKERGTIAVNISDGSVVCRLDNKLRGGAAFEVRTPNSIISAKGTVFCVDFTYHDTYNGYEGVMLTQVRSVESSLDLQLFNTSGEKSGEPQLLGEGLSAELMSCAGFNGYNYLNESYALTEFSADTLRNLIRIGGERDLPIDLADLNTAFNAVYGRPEDTSDAPIIAPPVTSAPDPNGTLAPFGSLPGNSETDRSILSSVPESTDSSESSVTTTTPGFGQGELTVSNVTTESTNTVTTTAPAPVTRPATTTPSPVWSTRPPVTKATTTAPTTAAPVTTATTTAAPATVYVPPVTTAAAVTAAPPVTAEATAAETTETTTAPVTETEETTTTVSLNWWEIINSNNTTTADAAESE